MIYLDNNATTCIAPEAFAAMTPYLTDFYGNPSAAYEFGRDLHSVIENSRSKLAQLVAARKNEEIIFTSGGTESDNWSIIGSLEAIPDKRHIVTTQVEHEAVRKVIESFEMKGYRVTWLDVDTNGAIDLMQLEDSLCAETALVSIMLANNETGVIFPIKEIGEIVKNRSEAVFHVDGVNAVGKMPINLGETDVDLFSISGHKFHAPKGVGALYIRGETKLTKQKIGGGQEGGRRAGTEAVHQIAGIGAAADFVADLSAMSPIKNLRNQLENFVLENIPETFVNGDKVNRICNTTNISFENTNGEAILAALNNEGICVSTGSACNAGAKKSSPVLASMGVSYSRAMGSIRFSLGRFNTQKEIDVVCSKLPAIISQVRGLHYK